MRGPNRAASGLLLALRNWAARAALSAVSFTWACYLLVVAVGRS
jgi:hypothetical protein